MAASDSEISLDGIWEIGYHIGSSYTKQCYAAEAVQTFLPVIMDKLVLQTMLGVCFAENAAFIKVMECCSFKKVFKDSGNYQGKDRKICKFLYSKS